MLWHLLGEGNYNVAYRNDDSSLVLKIPKKKYKAKDGGHAIPDFMLAADEPLRAVRLWNLINPHLHPKAYILNTEVGMGWVSPFVEGTIASDAEISHAVIDIFNATGRIVVDAISAGNFIKTKDGRIVCVDIGMALQFETMEERRYADGRTRRKSMVSLTAWEKQERRYLPFFRKYKSTFPLGVEVVQALLFITEHRPDIYAASFLKTKPTIMSQLASAYKKAVDSTEYRTAMSALESEVPMLRSAGDGLRGAVSTVPVSAMASTSALVTASAPAAAGAGGSLESTHSTSSTGDVLAAKPTKASELPTLAAPALAAIPAVLTSTVSRTSMTISLPAAAENAVAPINTDASSSDLPSIEEALKKVIVSTAPRCLMPSRQSHDFEQIRESCVNNLTNYINSRGVINLEGVFEPTLWTWFFRSLRITEQKVRRANDLVSQIRKTTTLVEIQSLLSQAQEDSTLLQASYTSGMAACLGKCLLISNKAAELAGVMEPPSLKLP